MKGNNLWIVVMIALVLGLVGGVIGGIVGKSITGKATLTRENRASSCDLDSVCEVNKTISTSTTSSALILTSKNKRVIVDGGLSVQNGLNSNGNSYFGGIITNQLDVSGPANIGNKNITGNYPFLLTQSIATGKNTISISPTVLYLDSKDIYSNTLKIGINKSGYLCVKYTGQVYSSNKPCN